MIQRGRDMERGECEREVWVVGGWGDGEQDREGRRGMEKEKGTGKES